MKRWQRSHGVWTRPSRFSTLILVTRCRLSTRVCWLIVRGWMGAPSLPLMTKSSNSDCLSRKGLLALCIDIPRSLQHCRNGVQEPPLLILLLSPTRCAYWTVFWIRTHAWGSEGRLWFTSDERELWFITDNGEANGLAIVKDSESGVIKLEYLEPTNQPPNAPWLSSRGYRISDDGWTLGISEKRLLRLPPHWRSMGTADRTWGGRFLALLHSASPEAIILELEG
ncbi:hypothetical protein BDM02DRAFT_1470097 [Thelephora ganbajun]|uniref:Uncharacterized protein n=1 Tax=Thelephora ganbajun TaxID=370292 RepID=A0ACB6Z1R8_THEGA|nr:hypothetical protein BDM02DRAFT_1470097 [Thelephora ganbajun]